MRCPQQFALLSTISAWVWCTSLKFHRTPGVPRRPACNFELPLRRYELIILWKTFKCVVDVDDRRRSLRSFAKRLPQTVTGLRHNAGFSLKQFYTRLTDVFVIQTSTLNSSVLTWIQSSKDGRSIRLMVGYRLVMHGSPKINHITYISYIILIQQYSNDSLACKQKQALYGAYKVPFAKISLI